jgi:ATP-dependent helicase HrpB
MASLPIDAILPDIATALAQSGRVVIEAPPGAGKTTRVATSLLSAAWLGYQRIVMLEPRRIAARAAARRMAAERGESVGETVGFRVRGETRVGPGTRVEVVTEGVLTRMLQDDLELSGVGMVIFDEFHERSLIADTGLALLLGGTCLLRDDLRIAVMSATLDGAAVSRVLNDCPVVRSAGRSFPVDTRWDAPLAGSRIEAHVARVVRDILRNEAGSLLVFLPGVGEIRRIADSLGDSLPNDVDLLPLHGTLSATEQDAAIEPSPSGRRKVVLTTNVAETSVTIEGITVVIDAGLERVPRFSPRTGMTRLETVRIGRHSADQRRGRAGRTAPGICIRCWSMGEDAALLSGSRPEILDADLSPLALDLSIAGFASPDELPWLDPPPIAAFTVARQLLRSLGALDADGRVTEHGKAMSRLGMPPRLSHLLLMARIKGAASLARAVMLVALLEDRDVMRGEGGPPPADIRLRLDALEHPRRADGHGTIDRNGLARVRERVNTILQLMGRPEVDPVNAEDAGTILLAGWPERLAQRREGAGRFLLRNGRGATLPLSDPLANSEWLVVIAIDDVGREGRIQLAAPVDADTVSSLVTTEGVNGEVVSWDSNTRKVIARRQQRLGAIVLADHQLSNPSPELVQQAMIAGIRGEGIGSFPWPVTAQRYRQRLQFCHHHDPTWPDVSDAVLNEKLETWLQPHLGGARSWTDIADDRLVIGLRSLISWEQQRQLDQLAPDRWKVPSGSAWPLDYADPDAPVLAVRLQEVFGMLETPRLMTGSVPVVMHLLSPARRPVQVTRDLASFWRTGYFDVRKDLKARYPKHAWPDDPTVAKAVAGVRRK